MAIGFVGTVWGLLVYLLFKAEDIIHFDTPDDLPVWMTNFYSKCSSNAMETENAFSNFLVGDAYATTGFLTFPLSLYLCSLYKSSSGLPYPETKVMSGYMNFAKRLLVFVSGALVACIPWWTNWTQEKSWISMVVEVMIPSAISAVCMRLGPYDKIANML
jgi:hypothetical protein